MANLSCIVEKQTPNYIVLCSNRKVTMPQIPEVAGEVLPKIWEYAQKHEKIMTAGPAIFFYECEGECDDETAVVELTLAIPIVSGDEVEDLPEGVELKEYPSIRVVSIEHPGSMTTIGNSYDKLDKAAAAQNLPIAHGYGREIYTHWIGYDSPENRTEIQFVLKD